MIWSRDGILLFQTSGCAIQYKKWGWHYHRQVGRPRSTGLCMHMLGPTALSILPTGLTCSSPAQASYNIKQHLITLTPISCYPGPQACYLTGPHHLASHSQPQFFLPCRVPLALWKLFVSHFLWHCVTGCLVCSKIPFEYRRLIVKSCDINWKLCCEPYKEKQITFTNQSPPNWWCSLTSHTLCVGIHMSKNRLLFASFPAKILKLCACTRHCMVMHFLTSLPIYLSGLHDIVW